MLDIVNSDSCVLRSLIVVTKKILAHRLLKKLPSFLNQDTTDSYSALFDLAKHIQMLSNQSRLCQLSNQLSEEDIEKHLGAFIKAGSQIEGEMLETLKYCYKMMLVIRNDHPMYDLILFSQDVHFVADDIELMAGMNIAEYVRNAALEIESEQIAQQLLSAELKIRLMNFAGAAKRVKDAADNIISLVKQLEESSLVMWTEEYYFELHKDVMFLKERIFEILSAMLPEFHEDARSELFELAKNINLLSIHTCNTSGLDVFGIYKRIDRLVVFISSAMKQELEQERRTFIFLLEQIADKRREMLESMQKQPLLKLQNIAVRLGEIGTELIKNYADLRKILQDIRSAQTIWTEGEISDNLIVAETNIEANDLFSLTCQFEHLKTLIDGVISKFGYSL